MEKSKKDLMYFLFGIFYKKDISTLKYCITKYSFSQEDKRQKLLLRCITYLHLINTDNTNIAFNPITEKIESIKKQTHDDYWKDDKKKEKYMLTVNFLVNFNNPLNKDGKELPQDDYDLKQFIENFSKENKNYENYYQEAENKYNPEWGNNLIFIRGEGEEE